MQVGSGNGMNESKTENKESGADGSESGKIKSYRASYQQLSLERMASLSAKASSALNLTFCCHVRGPLDLDCLQQAFIAVQMRHDALRTTIREGQCQIREENCLDFSSISVQGKEAPTDFAEWVLNQQYQTFDLVNGPLCRVRVIQESDATWWGNSNKIYVLPEPRTKSWLKTNYVRFFMTWSWILKCFDSQVSSFYKCFGQGGMDSSLDPAPCQCRSLELLARILCENTQVSRYPTGNHFKFHSNQCITSLNQEGRLSKISRCSSNSLCT